MQIPHRSHPRKPTPAGEERAVWGPRKRGYGRFGMTKLKDSAARLCPSRPKAGLLGDPAEAAPFQSKSQNRVFSAAC